jgi:hypothetical protein
MLGLPTARREGTAGHETGFVAGVPVVPVESSATNSCIVVGPGSEARRFPIKAKANDMVAGAESSS